MEHMGSCGFDTLFNKNMPHILEKIFLSLDYESLKTCYNVSNQWKEFITSDSFKGKARKQFSSDIEEEETWLCVASNMGNIDEVRSLLRYGLVDVNYVGWIHDRTALHEASQGGHNNVVKVLLDQGADPNIQADKEYGKTPLHMAAVGNHKEVVKTLLDKGADPNKEDEGKETPLHFASYKGFNGVVKLLLDGGADPNTVGTPEIVGTPLLFAVLGSQKEVVQTLVDAGADPNKGNEEISTLDLARERGLDEIVRILVGAGGVISISSDVILPYL